MRYTLILILVFSFGCDQPKEAPKTETTPPKTEAKLPEKPRENSETKPLSEKPGDMQPGESKSFGAEFVVAGDPVTLASAMKAGSENPVKVSGTIKKVCKAKGCWFTLTGPDVKREVRVKMKDYGFFVPKNADGGDAIVEGILSERNVPEDEAQHFADDEAKPGQTPVKIIGDQKTYEITATAVKIALVS